MLIPQYDVRCLHSRQQLTSTLVLSLLPLRLSLPGTFWHLCVDGTDDVILSDSVVERQLPTFGG
jgi:hypothetical protein